MARAQVYTTLAKMLGMTKEAVAWAAGMTIVIQGLDTQDRPQAVTVPGVVPGTGVLPPTWPGKPVQITR